MELQDFVYCGELSTHTKVLVIIDRSKKKYSQIVDHVSWMLEIGFQ